MHTKPSIRPAVDYLMKQGARFHVQAAATATDPLQIKREWLAQQLANVVIHHSKVRA